MNRITMKGLFFAFLTLIFCSGYFPCAATELPKVSDVSGIIHKSEQILANYAS